MKRRSVGLAVVASALIGGWYCGTQARAQGTSTAWLVVAGDFAQAISAGDLTRAAAYTTPEYQARIVANLGGQPPRCGLSGDGLAQNGALLRADYASVQLLCHHPDGVEEFVTVTLRKNGPEWKVCGGFTPK